MTGPGSVLWLLRHELRVGWRRMGARRGFHRRGWAQWAFLVGMPLLMTLFVGLPAGFHLRSHAVAVTPETAMVGVAILATLFTLMLSQALINTVAALYERGDLELLFSSPLDPRTVMAVRLLAVAVDACTVFGYFLVGPVIAIAALAGLGWLAGLAVLSALALGATGAAALLAWGLFRWIGPRRTRTVAHLLAALIGSGLFLAAQAHNILGDGPPEGVVVQARHLAHDHPSLAAALDWPLRAIMGEPGPLSAVVAICLGLFLLANLILGPRFAAGAAITAGAGAAGTAAAGRRRVEAQAGFVGGAFVATLRKELRLLARDPGLLTQVFMRVLYLLPIGFVLLRQAQEGHSLLMPGSAAALTLVAGQVAASLAWITISAEDAPDLLAAAPAPMAVVRQGKLAAVALPLAALLAPIILPLAVIAPRVGMATALGCAAAVWSAALINVWWQRPARRSEFRARRSAAWFVTVAEILVGLSISAAAGLAAAGAAWALLPVALAAGLMLVLRRSDARIAEALRAAV